ncbi:MAG: LysR family transcriptional regulator [Glaciimonas sp.]|nr:LysR family transcriptional regulator [Glaciimonas sp.]
MNFKQLKYFVSVAEELHFGRAAIRLHISQPPLSQQIKLLEDRLGVALFERNRRSVKLTASGQVFLQHAYQLIRQLQTAITDAKCAGRGEIGSLHIGYSRSALYCTKVLACIAAYREKYPEIDLQMQEGSTLSQIEDVAAERIDIGLVRGALPSSAKLLTSRTLSRERLVAILPLKHRLAGNTRISISDLRNERFVIFPRRLETALSDLVVSLLVKHGIQPDIAIEATSMSAIVGLVGAGVGVSIVPETVVQSHLSPVKVCQLREAVAEIELHVIARRKASPAANNFLSILQATLADC